MKIGLHMMKYTIFFYYGIIRSDFGPLRIAEEDRGPSIVEKFPIKGYCLPET
jgi:hypothetical protein